jgi:hypothetical protein
MRFVITPALLEVNGLSDLGVQIEMVRKHPRAPAYAVTIAWWRKQGDEFRAAVQERNRPKVGRMARLKGQVEQLAADKTMLMTDKVAQANAEVSGKLERMRSKERAKLAAGSSPSSRRPTAI